MSGLSLTSIKGERSSTHPVRRKEASSFVDNNGCLKKKEERGKRGAFPTDTKEKSGSSYESLVHLAMQYILSGKNKFSFCFTFGIRNSMADTRSRKKAYNEPQLTKNKPFPFLPNLGGRPDSTPAPSQASKQALRLHVQKKTREGRGGSQAHFFLLPRLPCMCVVRRRRRNRDGNQIMLKRKEEEERGRANSLLLLRSFSQRSDDSKGKEKEEEEEEKRFLQVVVFYLTGEERKKKKEKALGFSLFSLGNSSSSKFEYFASLLLRRDKNFGRKEEEKTSICEPSRKGFGFCRYTLAEGKEEEEENFSVPMLLLRSWRPPFHHQQRPGRWR